MPNPSPRFTLPRRLVVISAAVFFLAPQPALPQAPSANLRVATFSVDVTPPLGYPFTYAKVVRIRDRQSAKGIAILNAGAPIILVAVDWGGIDGATRDEWARRLAEAAGTTPDRVAIHVLHQHEAGGGRLGLSNELLKRGLASPPAPGEPDQNGYVEQVMSSSVQALRAALPAAKPVTHIGTAKAKAERIASNRRILGPDGKVTLVRQSAYVYTPHVHKRLQEWARRDGYRLSPDYPEEARNAPEGLIDPYVHMLSFWNGDKPVAALSYYATHPQLTVGTGVVTSDFVGLARTNREQETGTFHVHFNGAGGNVTPGKYSDGSEQALLGMTSRMTDALTRAWKSTKRQKVRPTDVEWRTTTVHLRSKFTEAPEELRRIADNPNKPKEERAEAVRKLVFIERLNGGTRLNALRLGDAYSVYMPSELFVEYQLAAQKMRPQNFVAMAAYGEALSYIGTAKAYSEGGYETVTASSLTADAEPILLEGMSQLLR